PLQLGRDALGHLACPGQVVQGHGAAREVAAPPLVKPSLGAAQRLADIRDRMAGETERNGTVACREFVFHGNLRGAAASGWQRRSLETRGAARRRLEGPGTTGKPSAISTMCWRFAA